MSQTPQAKNIVLVHGAFADGSSWSKVIPLLQAKGYKVTSVANPLTSFQEDVAATKRAIAAQDGPVVVPVDEVDGIHAIDERTLKAASASGTQASARFTQGVLQFKGRSLRWLDEEQLLSAVTRSLT